MTDSENPAYHHAVVARAIALIDGPGGRSLSLEALAERLGMSPAHFQRVFTVWAGVSPKRVQQYLALDHARRLLRERRSTLDTALEAGLSGAGRLHDLFLRWEAMTPGAYGRGGAELDIAHGWFDSPFGPCLAMGTEIGLCGMAFADALGREAAMEDLAGRWPAARFREDPAALAPWVAAAFGGGGEARLHLIGAPFQLQVWEALLRIAPGEVSTYGTLAAHLGRPRAARAVGTAVGRNPVAWLIPCHRVLRETGGLGGYHWGLPVKRAMLAWEGARADTIGENPPEARQAS